MQMWGRSQWRLLLGVVIASVAFALPAAAQTMDVDAAKSKAEAELDAGQAEAACATLEPFVASGDLVLRFLLGQCFAATGRPRAAIDQYRFILAQDPGAVRARAELAAAEAAAGDSAAAKSDLDAVLASAPPPEVQTKLQAMRDDLPSRPQWTSAVSASVMYDSNADLGPLNDVVTLFGSPYRLTNAPPRAEGDWAGLATANLDVLYPIDTNWSIKADAAVDDVTYAKLRQFDFDSFSFSAGPTFQTDFVTLTADLGTNYAILDNVRYSSSWGAEPDLALRLTDALTFDEHVNVQANRYYTTSATDGQSDSAITSLQWNYSGTEAYLAPKLTLGHQDARNALYVDDQTGGEIDWFQPLGAEFSLLLEPGINAADFRAKDPAFGTVRHDKTYDLTANLGYEPGFHDAQISLGVTVTSNRSNQSLYSYDRVQTTLQLKMPL